MLLPEADERPGVSPCLCPHDCFWPLPDTLHPSKRTGRSCVIGTVVLTLACLNTWCSSLYGGACGQVFFRVSMAVLSLSEAHLMLLDFDSTVE